jgi:hypothetical protein
MIAFKVNNRNYSSPSSEQHFYQSVGRGRKLQATDPRDRVFAFCAMAGSMRADYSKSVREICCDCERQNLEVLGYNFRFLYNSGTRNFDQSTHMLRSWTCDLTGTWNYWPSGCAEAYSADSGLDCPRGEITSQQSLSAFGNTCEVVLFVGIELSRGSTNLQNLNQSYCWSGKPPVRYPTGISRQQALARTLALDYDCKQKLRIDTSSSQGQAHLLTALGYMITMSRSGTRAALNTLATELHAYEVLFAHYNLLSALVHIIFDDTAKPIKWADESEGQTLVEAASRNMIFTRWLVLVATYNKRFFHTNEGDT